MDDKHLQHNVLDELEFLPSIDAANIGVAVEDGVVTLTGHVSSFAEKFAAERAVRQLKGVRAIAQEIEVRYPSDKKTADDEIAKRALSIIKWQAMIPQDAVKVKVQTGLITLSGEMNWQYQRKSAENAVRQLSGVTGVFNDISLKRTVSASDIKKEIEGALARYGHTEAEAIWVAVDDRNNVLIEGDVDSWDEREAIEDAVWSVAGVQSVDDRLAIARLV